MVDEQVTLACRRCGHEFEVATGQWTGKVIVPEDKRSRRLCGLCEEDTKADAWGTTGSV